MQVVVSIPRKVKTYKTWKAQLGTCVEDTGNSGELTKKLEEVEMLEHSYRDPLGDSLVKLFLLTPNFLQELSSSFRSSAPIFDFIGASVFLLAPNH